MFAFDLNTDALAAAVDRLKAELPKASREAVLATAQESLARISKPSYWQGRTGKTAKSFSARVTSDYASTVTSGSPVAAFLNDGTRAHIIAAKGSGFLRFVQNGSVRFARRVRHPGTKVLNYEATEQREGQKDLADYGDSALRRAVERSGLG